MVEHGLPRELVVDSSFVDEVAVGLACGGQLVTLTPCERAEAVRRLRAAGLLTGQIADRLRMAYRDVLGPAAPARPAA